MKLTTEQRIQLGRDYIAAVEAGTKKEFVEQSGVSDRSLRRYAELARQNPETADTPAPDKPKADTPTKARKSTKSKKVAGKAPTKRSASEAKNMASVGNTKDKSAPKSKAKPKAKSKAKKAAPKPKYSYSMFTSTVYLFRELGSDIATKVFTAAEPSFKEIEELVASENFKPEQLAVYFESATVAEIADSLGIDGWVVKDGVLYIQDKKVPEEVYSTIKPVLASQPEDSDRVIAFFNRLAKNPSKRVFETLFMFLEHNCIKLREDGSVLAYKAVRPDLYDLYSNKIKNKIGATITMPREDVNDDPNQTCSHGLHVGALEYAEQYGSGRDSVILEVSVAPEDFVSVPTDYNGQKARTCAYTVLGVHSGKVVEGKPE